MSCCGMAFDAQVWVLQKDFDPGHGRIAPVRLENFSGRRPDGRVLVGDPFAEFSRIHLALDMRQGKKSLTTGPRVHVLGPQQ